MSNDENKYNTIYYLGSKLSKFLNDVINKHYKIEVIDEEKVNNLQSEIILFDKDKVDKIVVSHNNRYIDAEKLKSDLVDKIRDLYFQNIDLYYLYYKFKGLEIKQSIQNVLTGLSYSLFGLIEKEFNEKSINLSLSSQDIYYACNIAQKCIESSKNINRVILTLSYYSFNFDLSKSINERVRIENVYYPFLGDYNNYYDCPTSRFELDTVYKYIKEMYGDIFDADILELEASREIIDVYFNGNITREYTSGQYRAFRSFSEDLKELKAKDRTDAHSYLLKYKETINENVRILNKFLEYSQSNNVEVVILILPVTKHYSKNSNSQLKELFYSKINILNKLYNFEVLDMFENNDFTDDDFIDSDHLNEKGAVKASKIVNSYLMK